MEKTRIQTFGLERSEYSQSGAFQQSDGTVSVSLDPRDWEELLVWSSDSKIQHIHMEFLGFEGVPSINLDTWPQKEVLETLSFSGYFVAELVKGLDDLVQNSMNLKAFLSTVESAQLQLRADSFRLLERLQIKWSQLIGWEDFSGRKSLRTFRVDNFSGKIVALGPLPTLKSLYIYDSKLTDLTDFGHLFPALETLVLSNCSGKVDIRPLAGLGHLENLKVERTKITHEGELVVPSLKRALLSSLHDPRFFSRNPHIEWFRAKKYDGEVTSELQRLGWDTTLNGFGGSKGRVPEELKD